MSMTDDLVLDRIEHEGRRLEVSGLDPGSAAPRGNAHGKPGTKLLYLGLVWAVTVALRALTGAIARRRDSLMAVTDDLVVDRIDLEAPSPAVSSPSRDSEAPRRSATGEGLKRETKLLYLGMACGITIVLQALTGAIARSTGTPPDVIFWPSLALAFGVTLAVVASPGLTRSDTAVGIAVLSVTMQLTRYVLYPHMFVSHDELQHFRTLESILDLHRLYTPNSTLPVSALFPGLETATAGVVALTGLSAHTAGVVVLLASRLVMALALFFIVARLLDSSRAAGVASLIYVANPQYLFFNSQYAYQTLALALAFGYVYLIVALERRPPRLAVLWLLPVAVAIAVTHHLTSWGLTALLLTWLLAGRCVGRRTRHLALATVSIALSVVVWTILQRHILFPYLNEVLVQQVRSITQFIAGHSNHKFFTTSTQDPTPTWQRVSAVVAVLIVLALLPVALWTTRRWVTQRRAAAITTALVALTYPLLPAGHLTSPTADLADRASGFVFACLAVVLAAWLFTTRHSLVLRLPVVRRVGWLIPSMFLACGIALFVGDTIIASGPPSSRAPGHYIVGGENRAVDRFAVAAGTWEGSHLPAYARTFSDRTNGLLAADLGDQHVVSAAADGVSTYAISRLLLAPPSPSDAVTIRRDRIDYLVVDTRLATALPDVGEYVETGEYGGASRTKPPSWSAVTKFNFVPGVDRIYDNGPIRIYNVRGIR